MNTAGLYHERGRHSMIFIATQCFPPRIGGIENLLYNISAALAARGHATMVFADGDKGPEEIAFDQAQAFSIRRFSGIKPWRRRRKALAIRRQTALKKPLGLITDSWKSLEILDVGPIPSVLCLAHGTELPVHCSTSKAGRIRGSLNKASAIIANSRYTADRAVNFVQDPARLHVIHPGINPPATPAPDIVNQIEDRLGSHDPVLISVARLERRKGIHKALAILPGLIDHHPGLLYVIIGEGSERTLLRNMASELNIQNHVLFAGSVTAAERNAYLERSDLFLLPGGTEGNDVEGFGIACIEAACLGVPAVAGVSGGVAEAVIHDQTGLICPADDQQALLHAALRILGGRELRDRLSKNARHRAEGLLWTKVIEDYEKLLGIRQQYR